MEATRAPRTVRKLARAPNIRASRLRDSNIFHVAPCPMPLPATRRARRDRPAPVLALAENGALRTRLRRPFLSPYFSGFLLYVGTPYLCLLLAALLRNGTALHRRSGRACL